MTGYRDLSTLTSTARETDLALATALGVTPDGVEQHPRFFEGFVARPDVLAAGLLAVADVAATSYFDLAAVRLASLDPVVTAHGDRLRFESFSRCNGVHARFDLLPDGIDSGTVGARTTNVDVNQPLRTHLASVSPATLLHLAVGRDLTVSTPEETHVEREVDLPDRWVRGFAQVPGIAATMTLAARLPRAATMRLLAGLPRSTPGPTEHLAVTAAGLRPTTRDRCEVHLAGSARLGAARRVLRFAEGAGVHRHESGASGWTFDLPGARLTLMLTAQTSRGFSGEGSMLTAAQSGSPLDDERVEEALAWQAEVDPARLAAQLDLPLERTRAAVARLGASGRVGHDLAQGTWFHRDLPLDEERLTRDNPRLARARELVEAAAVRHDGDSWQVGRRWVTLDDGRWTCTCPWHVRYAGTRGPCAHVMAVQLVTAPDPGTPLS
ncbi:SWIM zinc finger domain-containing protein [Alteromonas gracilis]